MRAPDEGLENITEGQISPARKQATVFLTNRQRAAN